MVFMERCIEQKKYLHIIFIDLKKIYDKVPKMPCGGPFRSTKFQSSTLPSLRICTIIL
jgi:hypothetical protein